MSLAVLLILLFYCGSELCLAVGVGLVVGGVMTCWCLGAILVSLA